MSQIIVVVIYPKLIELTKISKTITQLAAELAAQDFGVILIRN